MGKMNKKGFVFSPLIQIVIWAIVLGLALAGLYSLIKSATGG
ncbi:MAG: hypothetical protein AABX11_06955 [Nanoarchaeota archaeon]